MSNKIPGILNNFSYNFEIRSFSFKMLKGIREVSLATIENNKPKVRIVVILDIKDEILYFMTAKGKDLSKQMHINPNVSIVGKDKDIMIRIDGDIKFAKDKSFLLNKIQGHEGMYENKTDILEMFYMENGTGEIFDLSEKIPKRLSFYFGEEKIIKKGYYISKKCVKCTECEKECVTGAIKNFQINEYHCIHCGRCKLYCKNNAIKTQNNKIDHEMNLS